MSNAGNCGSSPLGTSGGGSVERTHKSWSIYPQSPTRYQFINAISVSLIFSSSFSFSLLIHSLTKADEFLPLYRVSSTHVLFSPHIHNHESNGQSSVNPPSWEPCLSPTLAPSWLCTTIQTPLTEGYFSLLLNWCTAVYYIKAKRFGPIFPFYPNLTPDT